MQETFTATLFEALYWIATVSISIVLIAITVALFAIGIKFIRSSRTLLGSGSIVFALVASTMIVLMLEKQFF